MSENMMDNLNENNASQIPDIVPVALDRAGLLAAHQPRVTKVSFEDGSFVFLREATIGDTNYAFFERRAALIKKAIADGIEIDPGDEEAVNQLLQTHPDKYVLARSAASRLCDAAGQLLFDPDSEADLIALNGLGDSLLSAIDGAGKAKKS